MNVMDDYKYPINEIWYARKFKDHSRLKMLLKEYKRLNQGVVTKVGMWHTKAEEQMSMMGFIPYKDNQCECFYMSKKDRRKK